MKRAFDFIVSITAIVVAAPLLLVLAVTIYLRLGWPILFCQQRPGLGGRSFLLWKFRTMTDDREASGRLRSDVERLTPFGRWLRSTSLDELPELWNILRGDMSLVGPRPLLLQYLPLYSPRQARRHEVRPGLTGWAQVNGRNTLSWQERFELDVWYVDNRSFWLDLQIVLATVRCVLTRRGVSAAGEATMPAFTGNVVGRSVGLEADSEARTL